ncbi:MAG: hypothetical protein C6I01_00475, partial [Epsilonproteobacteria bacterium]|nr:hypothetical protein [Campylobacterota bacterium]
KKGNKKLSSFNFYPFQPLIGQCSIFPRFKPVSLFSNFQFLSFLKILNSFLPLFFTYTTEFPIGNLPSNIGGKRNWTSFPSIVKRYPEKGGGEENFEN